MSQELQEQITSLKQKIETYQKRLQELELEYKQVLEQEQEREKYISSSEIIDIIKTYTGRTSNMSTIKRWADQGFLGEIIDERQHFWALKSKQGKKRFVYPKKEVYQFLFDKKYIRPLYRILDRVQIKKPAQYVEQFAIVVKNELRGDSFYYTLQLEQNFQLLEHIREENIILADQSA